MERLAGWRGVECRHYCSVDFPSSISGIILQEGTQDEKIAGQEQRQKTAL